jgi:mono/diheme cytochrome c family protein
MFPQQPKIYLRIVSFLFGATALAASLSACRHEEPNFIYMPDMVYSPAFKAQKQGSMMPPVEGTVPRGFVKYAYAKADNETAGRELVNPFPRSQTVLARGQNMYNTYCIVCHGPAGEGDGSVVPKFPRPPSLQSDKVRNWKDGNIYHVITMGQNLMPSYASQVAPADRWAIIHYIRALQRSKHPTPEDLKAAGENHGQ